MIPQPLPDSFEQRARDEAATSVLVAAFVAGRDRRAAQEADEIRTLAAAAALVEEQRARLTTRASMKSDLPARSMVAELAAAARVSERTVQRQLDEASDLCSRFGGLVDALAAARISRAHVAVIHDAGFQIEDASARSVYVETAVGRAETTTPGRLRPIVQILAARAHPRTMQERHDRAIAERRVRVIDGSDGMADLHVTAAAVLIHAIHDRLTSDARCVIEARRADADDPSDDDGTDAADESDADHRTMDQLRVDVLTDLLLTGSPQSCRAGDGRDAITARVQIPLPVLTAIGSGDEPAILAGHGPIDPDTARRLAAGAPTWERVMTSPVTGAVMAVDTYRPCKAMERFLAVRDERCRFPGCRQPVWRCDIDHTVDAALGGPTDCRNLAHLCKRHHVLKHNSAWRVRQSSGGVLEWTSPTGRVYRDHSEPVVRFTPAAHPPGMDFRDPATWSRLGESDPPRF
ncbi:HNH endonuclease signature motif containing protein [Microbacterium sp. BK668]|uniref:HNH endonuclease signature motif containing protein n=1 Tax=Microbacterium sp. BK668 TaxID=2512118 RepID=UPI001FB5D366|nr:HNH endonuclease signature motif containing protein [Microbacterium sp. BK668]